MSFIKIITLLFSSANSQMLAGSQIDPSGHNCVIDGGYQWCESTQSCVRQWETPCESLNECHTCEELSCPMPELPTDTNSCNLNENTDECGCQTRCPYYDCSMKQCFSNVDCNPNQHCIRDTQEIIFKCVNNQNIIPDNCATYSMVVTPVKFVMEEQNYVHLCIVLHKILLIV